MLFSVSRLSSDDRTMVSGVRISCASLPGERSQIACVFVQAQEQRREAAGHVAQLVRRLRFREGRDQPFARQRVLARLPQARQAQRQPRREDEHRQHQRWRS